jgi:phosphoketolase
MMTILAGEIDEAITLVICSLLSAALTNEYRDGGASPRKLLRRIGAYWRAANYLSVGQICLYNNLPLRKSLELSHVKPQVSGTGARHRVSARGPGCRG